MLYSCRNAPQTLLEGMTNGNSRNATEEEMITSRGTDNAHVRFPQENGRPHVWLSTE